MKYRVVGFQTPGNATVVNFDTIVEARDFLEKTRKGGWYMAVIEKFVDEQWVIINSAEE